MPKKTMVKKPAIKKAKITLKSKKPTSKTMKIKITPKAKGGLKKSEKVAGKRMA